MSYFWNLPLFLPLTINLVDGRFLLRVLPPLARTPHFETGCLPPPVLPSPPPIGWATGFCAVPLTVGLMPSQRLLPALPHTMFWCSMLPSCPIVARHSIWTFLISPLGRSISTCLPSLARTCAYVPALLASCPPFPGISSTLWTSIPSGIFFTGIQFPTFGSTFSPDTTSSPTAKSFGQITYRLSPSLYFNRAMRAERLGSYSIASTIAGILSLRRWKS